MAGGDPRPFSRIQLFSGYLLAGPPLEERFGTSALRSAAHRHTLVILTFESCLGGMEQLCENFRFSDPLVISLSERIGGK
jgi:hypothetical protein